MSDWISVSKERRDEHAKTLPAKQGVKCWCGNELIYRGNCEYWCDDPMCMGLYVMDQDCHIVANGRVAKVREMRCNL